MTTVQLAIRSALEGKKASVERAASHDMQHWGRGVCDNLTSLTDQKSCLHALHNILVEKTNMCSIAVYSWELDTRLLVNKKHSPSDIPIHHDRQTCKVAFRSMLNYRKTPHWKAVRTARCEQCQNGLPPVRSSSGRCPSSYWCRITAMNLGKC